MNKKITLETIEISSFIIHHRDQKQKNNSAAPAILNLATDLSDDCWTQGNEPPCVPNNTSEPDCTDAQMDPVTCDPNFYDTMPIVGGVECAGTVVDFGCPPDLTDTGNDTGGLGGCVSDVFGDCSDGAGINCSEAGDVCYA